MSNPVTRRAGGVCDTTQTTRRATDVCTCDTYPDNLGPCWTYLKGHETENCCYCDHEQSCHNPLMNQLIDNAVLTNN